MPSEFDVVVIGAGTGGYVAAIRAAQLGLKVAVVERQKALGGTCLIWGCIPTKALLEHAHALKVVQNVKEWGVTIAEGAVGIDMTHVQARKDKVVTALTRGVEFLFKKNKIEWIKGTARIAGRGKLDISDGEPQSVTATREIVVATGRGPVTTGLGIESQGFNLDRGYISVDELFRTGVPGFSAVGDVITFGDGAAPHPQLAHVSSAEGIVTAERIAGQQVKPIN